MGKDVSESVNNATNENEKLYSCRACEQSAQAGSVACEECGEWYHFEYVGLNDISADSIQRDSVFVSITIFCIMTSVHSLKTFLKTLRINIMTRLSF